MIRHEIDLSNFKGKGVTLYIAFDISGTPDPFYIFITNEKGDITYYYRQINSANVTLNLPVHSDKVILNEFADHPVKSVMQRPIQITKIKYTPNKNIVQARNYPIEKIMDQLLPVISIPMMNPDGYPVKRPNGQVIMIPTNQPARFMPSIGLRQYSESVLNKFPQPTRVFVGDHEEGHYFFGRNIPAPHVMKQLPLEVQQMYQKDLLEDEEAADDYALHKLINAGYNFSGAFYSLRDFLPESYISSERMKKMYGTIERINKNLLQ